MKRKRSKTLAEIELKSELFNILVYIVEDSIDEKGISKIIDGEIMPQVEKYITHCH